jgi:hypothetical protein
MHESTIIGVCTIKIGIQFPKETFRTMSKAVSWIEKKNLPKKWKKKISVAISAQGSINY